MQVLQIAVGLDMVTGTWKAFTSLEGFLVGRAGWRAQGLVDEKRCVTTCSPSTGFGAARE